MGWNSPPAMPDTKTRLHPGHRDMVTEGFTEFFDTGEVKGTLSWERLEEGILGWEICSEVILFYLFHV